MLNHRKPQSRDPLAIDLGAFHTRIYGSHQGVLLDQASIGVVDIDHYSGGIDAVGPFGTRAEETLGNADDQFRAVQPIQSDLHNELVPHDCNSTITDQLLKTCHSAGAAKTTLTDAALSAFYGMQLDHSQACVLIDFGATDSRLAAIVDGVVVYHKTLDCGGDTLDQALYYGVLKQFGLHLTQTQIRQIKHQLGAATPRSVVKCTHTSMPVDCLSVNRNATIRITLDTGIIYQLLQPMFAMLSQSIRLAFSNLPADIIDLAYDNGVQLCGGGALLTRMDQLVMETTDLPVELASRPLNCVVRGAAALHTVDGTQTAEAGIRAQNQAGLWNRESNR